MDNVLLSRFALPIFSILTYLFLCSITKPCRQIILKSLLVTPITGALTILSYLIGFKLGFWHYTVDNLIFGLPFDRFFSASIAYGAGFGLIYWRLRKDQSKYLNFFTILVPIYGILSDLLGTLITGTTYWSVDKSGWIIADSIAWVSSWTVMVIIYQKFVKI